MKEIKPYVLTLEAEKALSLKIVDNKSLELSADFLSRANKELDALTLDKKKLTDPINATLKAIRGKYKEAEERLATVISYLRSSQSAYATKVAEEKAKITERIGAGKGKLKMETALGKIEEIEIEKTIDTDSGSLSFRPTPKLKIVDATKIPREYLIPDEQKIFTALKADIKIAGCEVEIIQVPVNRR